MIFWYVLVFDLAIFIYAYIPHKRLHYGSSVKDMKNIFCLFERPFKIQKNGVFLFEISFFVLDILTFFYYVNSISEVCN